MEKTRKTKINLISRQFTLVEILIVCALIAILTSIGVAGFSVAMNKASEADTKSIIKQIEIAMDGYKAKYGFYLPSVHSKNDPRILQISDSEGSLSEFIPNYNKWKNSGIIGTYNEKENTLYDPYGTPFWFRSPGFHNRGYFDIESAGADADFGYSEKLGLNLKNENHDPSDPNSNYTPENQIDNISNWSHD